MMYNEVVQRDCDTSGACADRPDTWVTSKQFYAGLGVVQALPGPLFNFASYLGAIMAMNRGYVFVVGSLLAWFGLFLPGIMVGAALWCLRRPVWRRCSGPSSFSDLGCRPPPPRCLSLGPWRPRPRLSP
jgi:chromate transport protein ChrA